MTARTIMDCQHATLRADDRIRAAAQCIMERRYRSVPVTDGNGVYLGVFGVNCLLEQVLPRAAIIEDGVENLGFATDTLADLHQRFCEVEDQPVSVCMKTDVPTVAPDTPLLETLLILYRTHHSLPVVEPDSGRLLGMVTYWGVGEKILDA